MTDSPEVAAARIEAERCRARLIGTAEQLQQRLSPKRLTKDAWEGAKDKGADLAENAVDAVRSRPLAATGVVAAVGLFLARKPLMDLAGRIANGFTTKRATRKRAKTSKRTNKDTEAAE
ncbi:MAG: DUF3618 domain-containing protein [Sphingomicrobium sp.]